MQIERLIQMIFYLINHGHVTAKELADYFEVSTRTIYRDINTLTLAGIPIISTKGTGGGISLIEGYTLDKSLLSKDEQQQIYHGLQILNATKFPNAEIVLDKIGTIFRSALEPKWLEIDFTHWGSDSGEQIKLSELQYAITNKHLIKCTYLNTNLQKSDRIIAPLRLVFKSHAWYIVGFCHENEKIRFFRLSRMRKIEILSDVFDNVLPEDYDLFATDSDDVKNLSKLLLKFDADIAYKLYDNFHEEQIQVCKDGSYLVTVYYELNEWTINYLLSFGNHVEILEPQVARDIMKQRIKEMFTLYTT